MKQFNVTGMSCAACSARVEKAVKSVKGVEACSVNLLTNSMGVEGDVKDSEIISAVVAAGYGASLKDNKNAKKEDDFLKDTETPILLKRFLASLGFLVVLMYISMGHMMWGWPLPDLLAKNHMAQGLIQLLLSGIIMVINQKFFISGFKGLIHRSPNMDTLIAIGSSAAFGYSTFVLFAMIFAHGSGDHAAAAGYMHELYFESAAMILTLITLGKMLEARSKGKTTNALKGLMQLSPKTATVIIDGQERVVPAESVKKGDIFVVRPGESIPVDGIVLEGGGAVNESALTGESIPADKVVGDSVSAATINTSGFLRCSATAVGEDTTLAKIINMVSEAAATKAPIAKVADKVSGIFVPAVIGVAFITVIIWLLVGESFGFALARGISVLVISCPCALGLATPVAIMVGNGIGAKNGILFKTAVSLEQTGRTDIVVLDKTGTVTMGQPTVTEIVPNNISAKELLNAAFSLESKSEHPLAAAIVKKAEEENLSPEEVADFSAVPGKGLKGVLNGVCLYGGNYPYVSDVCDIPPESITAAEKYEQTGQTALYFAADNKFLGFICVADVIKADSPEACAELKKLGVRVVMLTGDNERTARAISEQIGVTEVIAGVLPDGKESTVKNLKNQGHVAMVGDGINDAPALTVADVGIAIGAGADIAMDAADIVLMKSSLKDVVAAIRLSKAILKIIYQNLFWAFIYNVIGIPLAAGAFSALLGWEMNPMFGAAAMSLSSFSVVTNALRLNFAAIRPKKDLKGSDSKIFMEDNKMEIIMKIEGMMCPRCEAHVKKALEAVDGVALATASHEKSEAIVTFNKEVDVSILKKVVEDEGYTVL